jgi:hypothetical protein
MFRQFLLIVVTSIIVAGCANVKINSSKAPAYNDTLSQLLVSLSLENGPIQSALVAKGLFERLAQRGVNVKVVVHEILEQEDPMRRAFAEFKPSQVLSLTAREQTTTSNGRTTIISVALDGDIFDVHTRSRVWSSKSRVEFSSMATHFGNDKEIADKLVDELIKKLDADRLLP